MTTDRKNRILITGAAGTIGSSLVRYYLSKGSVVCALDQSEDGLFKLGTELFPKYGFEKLKLFLGNIRDKERLKYAFRSVDIVIHTAALKHVELSEYNVMDCIDTNVDGTRNVVYAALDSGVNKVIFTSSDKAVNPTGTMGVTKLLGERIILDANYISGAESTKFSCVRFGNVLDSNGSVLTIFKEKRDKGEKFPITSLEMTRFFLTIQDAVSLVTKAVEKMQGGEIFIKNMGAASILTLAQAVAGREEVEYLITGTKSGEKLYEELTTVMEGERTIAVDDLLIILPEKKYGTDLSKGRGKLGKDSANGIILTSQTTNLDWRALAALIRGSA